MGAAVVGITFRAAALAAATLVVNGEELNPSFVIRPFFHLNAPKAVAAAICGDGLTNGPDVRHGSPYATAEALQ